MILLCTHALWEVAELVVLVYIDVVAEDQVGDGEADSQQLEDPELDV